MAHAVLTAFKDWPRDAATPLKKQQSLVRYIRGHSRHGRDMVDFMFKVLRGDNLLPPGPGEPRRHRYASTQQRMVAAMWLTERAYGKAKEFLDVTDSTPSRAQQRANLALLTDDERATLRALLTKTLDVVDAATIELTPEPDEPPQEAPAE
jgi:hypothetical protein